MPSRCGAESWLGMQGCLSRRRTPRHGQCERLRIGYKKDRRKRHGRRTGTGSGERIATRRGAGQGSPNTTGSKGFLSRRGRSCTRWHGCRRGPPTGCALLVLLLPPRTKGTATGSQHGGLSIPQTLFHWRSLSPSDLPPASHWQSLTTTGALTEAAKAHVVGGRGRVRSLPLCGLR